MYIPLSESALHGVLVHAFRSPSASLEDGRMSWPRTQEEAAELTEEQFQHLMLGLNPLNPKIKEVHPSKVC